MRPALDSAGHRVPRTKPTCLLHTWRPHLRRPFVLVLHLHQHQSSRNLHLHYLAKNQSTQHCQSLITPGSDHPPVLELHMVLTWATDAKNQSKPACGLGQASRPGLIIPGGPGGGSPPVSSGRHVFDFLVWSKNFREVKKDKIWFLGHSFLDYLKGRDGSSGIHPNSHPFARKQQP
jgi:hypothetical protein